MTGQGASLIHNPVTRAGILGVVFLLAMGIERIRPLRTPTQPQLQRVCRNLSIAAIGGVVFRIMVGGLVLRASAWSAGHQWGFLPLLIHSRWLRIGLGIVALDYLEYWWHWINHRVPFFWRFHSVHHVDLDLDVSTAARFHFGELFFAGFVQTGKVVILGIEPASFLLFQFVLVVAALFQHSNMRLPFALERLSVRIFVTPRMHGIHHSIVREETDSNFSVIFSAWDRLHRSLRLNVPQFAIIIGVPSYRDPAEVTLWRVLLLPLRHPRGWKYRDGRVPMREPFPVTSRSILAA